MLAKNRVWLSIAAALIAVAVVYYGVAPTFIAASQSRVLAIVNGSKITDDDIAAARAAIGAGLGQFPEATREQMILDLLVSRRLVSLAAEDKGLDKTDSFKIAMKFYRDKALEDVYIEKMVRETITDQAIQEIYDREISSQATEPEIRARHILFESQEEAQQVLAEISSGADFVEMAKKHSIGPSASSGGDLGFFDRQRMMPEFAEIAFTLEVGEVSKPVKTQFGWHIIKLEARRNKPPPMLETVTGQIREYLVGQQSREAIEQLKAEAAIELMEGASDPMLDNSLDEMPDDIPEDAIDVE